jgi:murein DD-endopeptidase MepM/ murein hydrolase activator NlpD
MASRSHIVSALALALVLAAPASAAPPDLAAEAASAKREAVRVVEGEAPRRPDAVFPVQGEVGFGEADARFGAWRGGRAHEGQDVFAPAGTPLVSLRDGVVVEKGDDGGRGNYVAIFSPDARQTAVYLHMLRPTRVGLGARVRAGERVGAVGCTGSCWGDHLHLELRRGRGTQGAPADPLPLLRRLRGG